MAPLTSVWNKTGITALTLLLQSYQLNSIFIERGTIVCSYQLQGQLIEW